MRHILIDQGNYEMDGDQHTATFDTFINLAESICGFGHTQREAIIDLLRQWKNESNQ